MTLWTVGHSTRSLDALVTLLRAHAIDTVVDVRTTPHSRRHPQFDRTALTESLPRALIAYVHMPGLGGLRKPRPDSPNTGLRTEGFRGYADYMHTGLFEHHVATLTSFAEGARAALMCAEASPSACHRWLLADALTARDLRVLHITDLGPPSPHVLPSWVQRDGARLTYPPRQGELPFGG